MRGKAFREGFSAFLRIFREPIARDLPGNDFRAPLTRGNPTVNSLEVYMLYWFLIIAGSIGLDQLTKWLAVTYLKGGDSFPLWEGVLHFTYVENTGAAFGIFKDQRWLFMVVSSVAIVLLIGYYFLGRPHDRLMTVALACVTGGGIGNMIDRILLGYVVDFIDFTLIDFAVFNIADSFVCIGVGLMFLSLLHSARREAREQAQGKHPQDGDGGEESAHDD